MTSSAPSSAPSPSVTVDALVREHLPVVGYQVNEVMGRLPGHVLRDDLVSAGLAALTAAAQAYDATTGVPFARYASLRIKGALLDELRAMDWAPRGARARTRALESAEDRLTVQLRRRPTRDELAAALGSAPADVDAARRDAQRSVLSVEAFEGTLADALPLDGPGPEELVLQSERMRYLGAAVTSLPERLRAVVEGLFLADRTVAEVAAELGVTESRISQLRTEALALLRDGMNASLDPQLVPEPARADGVAERRRQAYYAAVAARAGGAATVTAPVPAQGGPSVPAQPVPAPSLPQPRTAATA